MNRQKITACTLLLCMLPLTASANSSWRWISEARPYDVLPFVAIITIAIEAAARWLMLGRQHLTKIVVVVVLANLLSFAAPYLFDYWDAMWLWSMRELMDKFPSYTIRSAYFWMTLLVELPVVYFTLRKHAPKKLALLFTILAANTVTTLLTAAAERLFCYGQW